MCQLWAGGEAERQPSSESIKWVLGTFRWGWWISAQPAGSPMAGSPMAPVPPRPCMLGQWLRHTSHKAVASGGLELRLSIPIPKRDLRGVCGLLPKCPCSCPQLSCSPHCLLQRQPQAGHGDAGGLSEGRSKCRLVALCPRELRLLV